MRWWVNRGGQPEGPFEQAQVADQLRVGQLPATAQVAPESGGGWQVVSSVPEFASALAVGQNPETAATMAVDSKALFGPDGVPPPPTGSPIAGPPPGTPSPAPGPSSPGFGPGPAQPSSAPAPAAPPGRPVGAGVPAGNPMVAGTMAMDSASLMKAAAASQAGLGMAPGYQPPSAGSAPGVAPALSNMAPNNAFAAPEKPAASKLPYLLLGCGVLAFLVMICLAAGIIISRS